jgi:hypothetical protein
MLTAPYPARIIGRNAAEDGGLSTITLTLEKPWQVDRFQYSLSVTALCVHRSSVYACGAPQSVSAHLVVV